MRQQFALNEQKARLINYTPRRELHGEDPKPAATLRFGVTLGADLLAMFAPTLRSSFYCKREGVQRDLADAAADANDLRYPQIEDPIKWALEIVGAELTIDYGLGNKSNIVLPLCDIDEFTVSPQQGGVVLVVFRVACHPDEKQSGKLAMMIGKDDLKITLEPPAGDLVEQAEDAAKPDTPLATAGEEQQSKRSKRRAAADEAFH